MTFQNPQYLWLLLAMVPVVVLWRVARRHRDRRLADFIGKDTWPLLNATVSGRARWWKTMLMLLVLGLSIVAAARPLWGTRERVVHERGIDIIIAMDVSRSMLASDIAPSRLEQAKRRFRELLSQFPGHRIGIMPFAGEPFLEVPLTTDYGLALRVLETLDTRTIGTQGTDIAEAIERAREAFREGSVGSRVLLLITDGESHEGDVIEQARLAAEEGITIYSLGIGTPAGSPITLPDGTLFEDGEGRKVMSRMDAETLREVAEITDGQSYVARPGEQIDIAPLVSKLDAMERSEFEEDGQTRVVREERYQYPLALALALLFAEGLFGERRRRTIIAANGGANA